MAQGATPVTPNGGFLEAPILLHGATPVTPRGGCEPRRGLAVMGMEAGGGMAIRFLELLPEALEEDIEGGFQVPMADFKLKSLFA